MYRTIQDYTRLYRSILGLFNTMQDETKNMQDYSGQYRTIQDYTSLYRTIQNYVRLYRTILYYTGRYKTLQDYIGQYRTIQDYIGPYRTIQDYTGLYRTIQDHTGVHSLPEAPHQNGGQTHRQTDTHREFVESGGAHAPKNKNLSSGFVKSLFVFNLFISKLKETISRLVLPILQQRFLCTCYRKMVKAKS